MAKPFTPQAERQIRGLIATALNADRRGDRKTGDAAINQALVAGRDPKNRQR
jgi:hypothetical protein